MSGRRRGGPVAADRVEPEPYPEAGSEPVRPARAPARGPAVARDLPTAVGPPVRRAVMVQRWDDVVFLHWRYDPAEVQRLLPDGVVVDTHDDAAWVALVPFSMRGLGVPGWAPMPHVGEFPEVNVRTYVRAGDRRGVWFFSLDVDRLLPALVARGAYHLPYCAGSASHERLGGPAAERTTPQSRDGRGALVTTSVRRRWPRPAVTGSGASQGAPPPRADVTVRVGSAIEPGDRLARFLTGRWGLISATRRGALRWAPVEHPRWSLHEASVESLDESLVTAAGLPAPVGEPHAMWSPGVDVRVGRPVRIHGDRGVARRRGGRRWR